MFKIDSCFDCSQLDNRLTKVPPARATITTVPVKEPNDIDEPALRRTIMKNVSAGKSIPYTKTELKIYNEFQVKVSRSIEYQLIFGKYESDFLDNFHDFFKFMHINWK